MSCSLSPTWFFPISIHKGHGISQPFKIREKNQLVEIFFSTHLFSSYNIVFPSPTTSFFFTPYLFSFYQSIVFLSLNFFLRGRLFILLIATFSFSRHITFSFSHHICYSSLTIYLFISLTTSFFISLPTSFLLLTTSYFFFPVRSFSLARHFFLLRPHLFSLSERIEYMLFIVRK